jgi:hypothetical protein
MRVASSLTEGMSNESMRWGSLILQRTASGPGSVVPSRRSTSWPQSPHSNGLDNSTAYPRFGLRGRSFVDWRAGVGGNLVAVLACETPASVEANPR